MLSSAPFSLKPGPSLRIIENPPRDAQLKDLLGHLLVWEAPRSGQRYIVAADASYGIGKDRACVEVLRMGTLEEPDEEVAQFLSPTLDPTDLAYVVDQAGRLYPDEDGTEALAAVEVNGPGITTQTELQRHLGYGNLFRWQYYDTDTQGRSYSHKLGWWTTDQKTRPLVMQNLFGALKRVDPVTGKPDLVVRSPLTMSELRSLKVPDDYPIYMAEAPSGAHDDTVITIAIAAWVSRITLWTEREPVADARRRQSAERALRDKAEARAGRYDYQNTDCTVAEMRGEYADEADGIDYGHGGA